MRAERAQRLYTHENPPRREQMTGVSHRENPEYRAARRSWLVRSHLPVPRVSVCVCVHTHEFEY